MFSSRIVFLATLYVVNCGITTLSAGEPVAISAKDTKRLATSLSFVKAADGNTPFREVCEHIRLIGVLASNDPDAAELVLELLPENSPLYQNRIRSEVEVLRGGLLVALSRIGATPDAMLVVLAELETTKDPFTFGAACRVVQALGPRAAAAEKYLLRPFGRTIKDELFSLEEVTQAQPLRAPTTAQQEALKALAAIGPPAKSALATLKAISSGRIKSDVCDDNLMRELAARAMASIADNRTQPNCCRSDNRESPTIAKWISAADRSKLTIGDVQVFDDRGKRYLLRELLGKPIFLSFFYTRCDNPQKCSRTVSTVAKLQRSIGQCDLDGEVRVMLFTLDPAFDDSLRLRRYGRDRGFTSNADNIICRTTVDDLALFCEGLDLPVSLNNGSLSIHGIGGLLIDKNGRVAKTYEAVLWDNQEVVDDLRMLCGG